MWVFVARSHWDAVAVDAVLRSIECGGMVSWRAVDQIELRDDWEEVATSRIKEADALLFVTSPESVLSEPCLLELRLALEMGRQCWQWLLRDVPDELLPGHVRALPVIAVGTQVDACTWFNEAK